MLIFLFLIVQKCSKTNTREQNELTKSAFCKVRPDLLHLLLPKTAVMTPTYQSISIEAAMIYGGSETQHAAAFTSRPGFEQRSDRLLVLLVRARVRLSKGPVSTAERDTNVAVLSYICRAAPLLSALVMDGEVFTPLHCDSSCSVSHLDVCSNVSPHQRQGEPNTAALGSAQSKELVTRGDGGVQNRTGSGGNVFWISRERRRL